MTSKYGALPSLAHVWRGSPRTFSSSPRRPGCKFPTASLAASYPQRAKELDFAWTATIPKRSGGTPVITALEVAYRNENDASFEEEVRGWALSGINAIGVKIRVPPMAETRIDVNVRLPPMAKTISQIRAQASVVVVAQEKKTHTKRVWRYGPHSARTQMVRVPLSPPRAQTRGV
ncbi:unnamed protein product [Parajaminaea phylloscopi]